MTPAEKLLQKTLATSGLNSAQWNQVQAGLRDRAFFSSRVESARFLHAARGMTAELAAGKLGASEIRVKLREVLEAEGYAPAPGKEGGLQDLTSKRRLDLIIKTNADQARGYVQHVEATSPGALAAFPAQELIRVSSRKQPREWEQRWKGAGGRLYQGRMVALKGAAVWTKISRFGTPWAPFDFGSGMDVQDLSREEAVALGVMKESDPPPKPAPVPGFNANLEAEVPFAGKDAPEWMWLEDSFGDQIMQKDGKVRWVNDVIRSALDDPKPDPGRVVRLGKASAEMLSKAPPDIASALSGKKISVQKDWIWHLFKEGHVGDMANENEGNIKLTPEDFDLLAAVWRSPDAVTASNREKNAAILTLDTFDGGRLRLVVKNLDGGPRPASFHKKKL